MDMRDADKTTFIVRTRTYRFAGSTFQRVMDLALKSLNFNMCLVYLDDIIVYSSTVEEHLLCLRKPFDRLRAANLKLKPSKCSLLRAEVHFLGHVVSGERVATDPSKIDLVKEWPEPRDVHEVRSFLGLASYYRRFVPTFAEIAAPLHALMGRIANLNGRPSAKRHSPNWHSPQRVIAYASRSLGKPERNYCVTRKELLAIVCYTRTFRQYLVGKQFVIRMDHSALQWLRSTPEPIGQQA